MVGTDAVCTALRSSELCGFLCVCRERVWITVSSVLIDRSLVFSGGGERGVADGYGCIPFCKVCGSDVVIVVGRVIPYGGLKGEVCNDRCDVVL